MLTQRYALYVILTGLTILIAATLLVVMHGLNMFAPLIAFNGLLVVGAGVWMWVVGKTSV